MDLFKILSQLLVMPVGTSVVASLAWSLLRKPRLDAYPSNSNPKVSEKNLHGFYTVDVVNKGRVFIPSSTAYECIAELIFKSMDGKELIRVEGGKWVKGPEPIVVHLFKSKILKIPYESLIPSAQYRNIRCGTPEPLILVVKFEGDERIYAFSPLSYVKGMKSKEFRIGGIGKYLCEINVTCENARGKYKFIVENRGKGLYDVNIRRIR
ncbi:MAG: hypothetical protein DRJ41_00250 [Thermoprotei archaeon]|nr:MAG: hypothetical protein DRJ41_00250 [Thermoprotei archaeon]